MAEITMKRLQSGSTLLKKLLEKSDNGDGTLTANEVKQAAGAYGGRFGRTLPPDQWTIDPKTMEALLAAVNKKKSAGERSVTAIKKGVDEAFKEIKAANLDKNTKLSAAEEKKVKTALAKKLVAFSRAHGGKSASSFELNPRVQDVYVPSKPFRPPSTFTAGGYVKALVKHFNSYSNDNSQHGPRPQSITRFVLSKTEVQGMVKELAKLPDAKAKSALKYLSDWIQQKPNAGQGEPRVWVEPPGVPPLNALAKKLGISPNFVGDPAAPKFDYY